VNLNSLETCTHEWTISRKFIGLYLDLMAQAGGDREGTVASGIQQLRMPRDAPKRPKSDSGSSGGNFVKVQVLSSAPNDYKELKPRTGHFFKMACFASGCTLCPGFYCSSLRQRNPLLTHKSHA
jgi:hypothetical protein